MLVYHGSSLKIESPDIHIGRFNLDFGKGFYVTTLPKQAEKWAMRRAVMESKAPVVSVYEFGGEHLNILAFDGYTEAWLDFIIKNRSRTPVPETPLYDAVFGNIADDDVAAAVDEYMRLLSKGRVNADVKNAMLYQLSFSQPNNQYCLATQKSINALTFLKSYDAEV